MRGIGGRARLRDRLSSRQHDCHPWVVFIYTSIASPFFSSFFFFYIRSFKCVYQCSSPLLSCTEIFFFFLSGCSYSRESPSTLAPFQRQFQWKFSPTLFFYFFSFCCVLCVSHSVKWIALSLSFQKLYRHGHIIPSIEQHSSSIAPSVICAYTLFVRDSLCILGARYL